MLRCQNLLCMGANNAKNKDKGNNNINKSVKTMLQEGHDLGVTALQIKSACQNRKLNPVSQSHSEWVWLPQIC